ncbi:MAG TPA: TonB-dependent receptor plug domain-containing protein, partial [Candidatus Phocaeicola gallinarum]|nr:TonB-dependent receptor plug domain-containing protein [Candidatus Phocaeicola gallinarum]
MKNIITFLLVFFTATTVWAEKITVSGVVTDTNNEPLIGVNVTVKNVPGLGAITDLDGRYQIEIDLYSTLLFSYIGFDTQEVLVKDNMKTVNVKLKESSNNVIDEVVVTATGVQKKISVTGAITTVGVKDLQAAQGGNLSNALAGNVPGIMAMQTSGQPGQNTSEFWIRGISTFGANTSALVLVDGFERDLNDVNIEDIASFSVLKDASATAIYGSRGANGVVLITTKHGTAGKINIDAKVETSY